MHTYSFSEKEALELGIHDAIFMEELRRWIRHNRVKNRNIRDGYVWTFNTHDQWAGSIPIFSKKQIQRMIAELREKEKIMTAQYGGVDGNPYNRVTWITIPEYGEYDGTQEDESIDDSGSSNVPKMGSSNVTKMGSCKELNSITEELSGNQAEESTRPPDFASLEKPEGQNRISSTLVSPVNPPETEETRRHLERIKRRASIPEASHV